MGVVPRMVELGSGLVLSCVVQGDGSGPALVMVPGPTDSWHSYGPVLDHIPPSIPAVAVSLRGHGDSDKPAAGYRVDDFAADLIELLETLAVERAVLVGHSGSCLIARRVAIDRADLVAGLMLEASPSTLRGHSGMNELLQSVVSPLTDPIDPLIARSFVADTATGPVPPAFIDEMVDEVRKVPARVWKEMFEDLAVYDDIERLRSVRCTTLLIWGDNDDIVGEDVQDQLLKELSGAELKVFRGAGHTPRWEDPARFATLMVDFVQRVH